MRFALIVSTRWIPWNTLFWTVLTWDQYGWQWTGSGATETSLQVTYRICCVVSPTSRSTWTVEYRLLLSTPLNPSTKWLKTYLAAKNKMRGKLRLKQEPLQTTEHSPGNQQNAIPGRQVSATPGRSKKTRLISIYVLLGDEVPSTILWCYLFVLCILVCYILLCDQYMMAAEV